MAENTTPRRVDIGDVAGLIGVGLITGGVAMIHVPSAMIVCGALVLGGAILAARRA